MQIILGDSDDGPETSDIRLQTSDLGLLLGLVSYLLESAVWSPVSELQGHSIFAPGEKQEGIIHCGFPIADCKLGIGDCRFQIADLRYQLSDCKLRNAKCGMRKKTADIRPQTSDRADKNLFSFYNLDGLAKSQKVGFSVIPAKAGIQLFEDVLDPGFRRGDDPRDFLRVHQPWPWSGKFQSLMSCV